jgi:parallel beta-helix repeat protein
LITGDNVTLNGFQITGASGTGCGIRILGGENAVLVNNTVLNNDNGILLNNTSNVTMTNNSINNSLRNFGVYGNQIEQYRHNIDTSNLINGKPIYYIVGNDITLTGADNPGFIGLIEAGYNIGSSIEGVNISNNFQGILVVRSQFVGIGDIESCNLNNNEQGIYLWESVYTAIKNNNIENNTIGVTLTGNENIWGENVIFRNNITNNTQIGILINNSNGNYIQNNKITNSENGITIVNCDHILVNNANYIEYNTVGINVTTSNNEINNNNFINNTQQFSDDGTNSYDDEVNGNYWSDWQPPEHPTIEGDPDHIADPRQINENSWDNHPLAKEAEYKPPE